MARHSFGVSAVAVLAVVGLGSCFLTGLPQGSQPPRTAPNAVEHEMPQPSMAGTSWAAPLLSFGAALGLIFGVVAAKPARAITAEQFSQLTYAQVKGSGLANRCPTVESNGTEVPVKGGSRLVNVCFEPKSFAVEFETDKGKEFATTKLTTRQTYTLAFIEGSLDANPITFKEQDGMDFAATTVKLPDGEYVPFLFTVKELVAKGEGSSFKPGFTWGGEFSVPSYRTGGFLDPKGRGMTLGYDQAVALPAMQSDGQGGQDELFKETNKVFDLGKGVIEMEVNKAFSRTSHAVSGRPVNQELGEIGGVFVSKQPSDTDMGAKAPRTVLLKVAVLAVVGVGSCFLTGLPQGSQPPRAAPNAVEHEMPQPSMAGTSWAAPLLSFGAALGLIFGVVAAKPARAITAEQFSQLTYAQVKGSGLANRCPTVESNGTEVPVKGGSRLVNVCFEPKSFAVEFETDKGKEFATTKLTTRQTYTLAFIEGSLDANPITFKEQDGMDFAATTVKLPDGEYVPFLFTVKELVAKGEGSSFKPGFTWGGEFSVPSYRTGGFLDPKGRGMTLGYDQAVALPAMQSDGQGGQDELFKETNKVFDLGKGVIEMEVNKVNQELGEIGGVFVSKQPSDTDMGAKAPRTVLLKGIFYGKVVNA
ncbi:PSBO [Symbiodinium sp. CCMP2592]|nr:PSBO [Symbiodinium sp. CCMP2592]